MPTQNLNLSNLAKARLQKHASATGLKLSTIVNQLIMTHLPETSMDVIANAEYEIRMNNKEPK